MLQKKLKQANQYCKVQKYIKVSLIRLLKSSKLLTRHGFKKTGIK